MCMRQHNLNMHSNSYYVCVLAQEMPPGTARAPSLSLSRVKAEVAYSAACCTYTETQATNASATPEVLPMES